MDEAQFNKIIEHQVALILKEMGVCVGDLSSFEYLKHKYKVALMLLCELGD